MFCYECAVQGERREAIGMCHNCSLALCQEHAHVELAPIVATYGNPTYPSLIGTVKMPLEARKLLCGVCQAALSQKFDASKSSKPAREPDKGRAKPPGLHQAA